MRPGCSYCELAKSWKKLPILCRARAVAQARVSLLCLYEHNGECFAGYQVPPKRAFRPLQSGHRSSL